MIELTLEQRHAVAQDAEAPLRALDPDSQTTYIMIPEDKYNRIKSLLVSDESDTFARDVYDHVMQVFGRDGWDDPAMDVYNELDPRRNP